MRCDINNPVNVTIEINAEGQDKQIIIEGQERKTNIAFSFTFHYSDITIKGNTSASLPSCVNNIVYIMIHDQRAKLKIIDNNNKVWCIYITPIF